MKSKFDISFPFTDKYNCAYLVSSQGRNSVVLYNTDTKERTTISNAKYMMSVHLQRHLMHDEHVDHINDNKLDDRIDNFQILSLADNNRKQASLVGCSVIEYECPICSKHFVLKKKYSHYYKPYGSLTCSRSCGGKASHFSEPQIIVVREYNWYDENHWSHQIGSTRHMIN